MHSSKKEKICTNVLLGNCSFRVSISLFSRQKLIHIFRIVKYINEVDYKIAECENKVNMWVNQAIKLVCI